MRYYVVVEGTGPVLPHIIGEVVRDFFDDGLYRHIGLASALVGEGSRVVLEAELLPTREGRQMLDRWNKMDDSAFNEHTRLVIESTTIEEAPPVRRLRLVAQAPERAATDSLDERRRLPQRRARWSSSRERRTSS